MLLKIAVCILIATFFPETETQPDQKILCPMNQTYKNEGFDCNNCKLYRSGAIVRCPLIKEEKCYCNDNYIRLENTTSLCVLKKDCPPLCGINEIEITCANPCQPTCSNIDRPHCYVPFCRPGCNCRFGYVRDDKTKECIPFSQCKNPRCPDPNQIARVACDCDLARSCQNPNPEVCLTICRVGCYCKPGYLKSGIRCVKKDECPPRPL